MAAITWSKTGSRKFETGIDHGVLYVKNQIGVPWLGLKSIDIKETGGSSSPQYIEGKKFANTSLNYEVNATLKAVTVPEEFKACDGVNKLTYVGLFATRQERVSFDLSWRSYIGNDISDTSYGYKIHLLYNCLALPSDKNYTTVSDSASIVEYSYNITATPKQFGDRKPTSYLSINSLNYTQTQMSQLENILYGTDNTNARMITASELMSIFGV